jgi:hypothetical protein
MKNLLILLLVLAGFTAAGQTYNPATHTVTNKSIGVAQAAPTDARSMFFDQTYFVYRAYTSTSEVLSYLNLSKYREGKFDIIVNSGGVLSNGVITGGTNTVYYFKDGTADGNLVRKSDVISVNGQIGIVVAKNADSLRGMSIDTGATAIRDNYAIVFDSTNRKWILGAAASGDGSYTEGTGIDITGSVISVLNTSAIFNANQLRGRSISTETPASGQVMKWDGTEWVYDDMGIDTGYITTTEDTLRLIVGEYTDSLYAAITPAGEHDETLLGVGTTGDQLRVDTLQWIATIHMINDLNYRIDTLTVSGSGITSVVSDPYTFNGAGITGDTLKIDTAIMATKSYVDNLPGITPPDGSETHVDAGVGISVSGDGTSATPYIITYTGGGTTNPFNALDIRNYGGVADASTPAAGAVPNGTNNTPFLQAMLTAASSGQLCIVPSGNWKFSTALDTITGGTGSQNKVVNLLFIGDVYLANNDFIRITNQAGAYEQHRIIFQGLVLGNTNQPSQNYTNYIAGTGPQWGNYLGVVVKIINTNQSYIEFNKVDYCKSPIEIIGSGGNGGQENTIVGRWFRANRYGMMLTSLDGSSFVDKNIFTGPANGTLRVGGNIPLFIDGYSSPAFNGEVYNGAFRSNKFHFMLENADSLPVCNGDITEPLFDITVEGGTTTGVLNANAIWRMRSVSPNYVRSPKYVGQGVFGSQRLGTGSTGTMGIDGTIKVPIWNVGTYYGNEAIIDGNGQINIFCRNSLTQSQRSGAPGYIKFVNYESPDVTTTTSSSSYTVSATDKFVFSSNAAATITLPSPSTYPTRVVTITNTHSTGTATVAGTIASGFATSVGPRRTIQYRSDGVNWYTISEAENDGYIKYAVTTTSASGSTLAAVSLPASKGMELEVIIMGYRTADQTLYRTHLLKGYATTASASSLKTSTSIGSHTSDFTPAVFTEQAGGTLTYTITVSSVSTETVQWVAYVKLRPTFTSL